MKKLAFMLSMFFLVAISSPASAEDDLASRSQAVLQLASSLTHSVDSVPGFSFGDIRLEHKLSQGSNITVSSHFRSTDGKDHSLEVSPNYVSADSRNTGALSSSITADKSRLFVASTTQNTMRIISQTFSKESTSSIEFKTNLPKDSYLLNVPNVGIQILTSDGTYCGTLETPWAFDAHKQRLASSFSLVDGMLVQKIFVRNDTAYPVLSDPNWTYSLDFWINTANSSVSSKTPNMATAILKSCFSCYFPIQGAPAIYPFVGQTMPLKVVRPLPPFDTLPAPFE